MASVGKDLQGGKARFVPALPPALECLSRLICCEDNFLKEGEEINK